MPALKLELEVDPTAHPELFALLSAIENPAYRTERVRQLAVTGLILERLRLAPEAVQAPTADKPEAPPQGSHLALVMPVAPPRPELQNFPVLHEEVPESLLRRKLDAEPAQPAEPEPPAPAPPPPAAVVAPVDPAMPMDTAPVVHMPGTRSRLMRMKNRGLFTNE